MAYQQTCKWSFFMLAVTRSAIFLNRSTGGRQEVILPLTISDRIFKNEIVTLVVSWTRIRRPGYDKNATGDKNKNLISWIGWLNKSRMISMREVFNLFSLDSVLQVKRSCYFTDYQFRRPTTSSGLYNVIG